MADEYSELRTRLDRIEAVEACRRTFYELSLAPVEACWRIESLRISSTTGWMIQQEAPPFLANPLAAGTLRGGRPAVIGAASSRG